MPPHWIDSLEAFHVWLEQQLDRSGGEGDFQFEFIEIGPDEFSGLYVPRQNLFFFNGTQLEFTLYVNSEMECEGYSYHYSQSHNDLLIWRIDKHEGHEDQDGGMTHVHEWPGRRYPYREIDFDDAIDIACNIAPLWPGERPT